MATPGGKSMVDSDDDLAGFLAGLRKRYNLDTSPLPVGTPLSRLAISTEANISGSNTIARQPEFLTPDRILVSPSPNGGSAAEGQTAADAAAVGAASTSQFATADSKEVPSPRSPTSSSIAGPNDDALETAEVQQQHSRAEHAAKQGAYELMDDPGALQPQYYPHAQSESGSCDSPHTLMLLQNLQQQTASQLAMAAGGADNSTPTDVLTIAGGAVGAVASRSSPCTTAAMPSAWATRLQEPNSPLPSATAVAAETAAAAAAARHNSGYAAEVGSTATAAAVSETVAGDQHRQHLQAVAVLDLALQQAVATPLPVSGTASPQMAAADNSSSTDFDSPSVKKPLYGAFMAAAAAAAVEEPEAAAAAAAGGGTTRDIHASAAAAVAAAMLAGQQQARPVESVSATASTTSTPGSSRLGSPGHVKRNVSFSMELATATAVPAQLQQLIVEEEQQQQVSGLVSPGSVWRRSSSPPARGVLKHDSQQQQQPQQHFLSSHQQVWHKNELYAGSRVPLQDTEITLEALSSAEQQQQAHDETGVNLRPWGGAIQVQQLQHQQQQQLEQQSPMQQHAEPQWYIEQQQQQLLHAAPPRSPVLQQAWEKLHFVQGSLQQLQPQQGVMEQLQPQQGSLEQLQPHQNSLTSGLLGGSSHFPLPATAANAVVPGDQQQQQPEHEQQHEAHVVAQDWSRDVAAFQCMTAAQAAAAAAEEAAATVPEAAAALHAVALESPSEAPAAAAADLNRTAISTSTAAAAAGGDGVAVSATADWLKLNNQLSMAGFGSLSLVEGREAAAAMEAIGGSLVPELTLLHDTLSRVLREYQMRDGLMAQLLQDRDASRRDASRSAGELSKAERQRDEASRALERTKAELADVRSRDIPALEAKHKDAQAKLNSEVAKLKHSLKEAESATAAAKQAAAAAGQDQVQQQLQEAIKERERFSLECERLASEVAKQKPYVRDLERAAAAARATARQSDEAAALLQRQLGQMRQQQQQEMDALAAELNKARHTMREAEQQLSALKTEAASRSDTTQELMKQLALERTQHEEQSAHLSSELQKVRQQLLALQQAAAKAEAAAKADSSAALYSSKQLSVQERSHNVEVTKLTSDLKQMREANQLLQVKLQEADAAVVEQAAAATKAALEAKAEANKAANLALELEQVQSGSKQQLQKLSKQLSECKKTLAESQQQLSSTQAELMRLRAAAGLVDGTAGAAAAAAGTGALAAAAGVLKADTSTSTISVGFSVKPPAAAKVVLQQIGDGNIPTLAGQQQDRQGLLELTPAPTTATAAAAGASQSSGLDKENSFSGNMSSSSNSGAAGNTSKQDTAGNTLVVATAAGGAGSDGSGTSSTAALSGADLAAALGRAVRAEAAAAEAEGALVALRYKMLTLEAAATRMERETESLRDRLGDKVIKEERRLARDKSAYARIRQAHASSVKRSAPAGMLNGLAPSSGAAAAARRAAAGAVAAAARELRPVELVGIYEGQKEALERDLASAKAEVRVLSAQLRDAQNLLITKDRAAAVAAAAAGLKGGAAAAAGLGDPAAAVAAQRKAAELTRELCTVRAEAASALREAAKRLAETESQLQQLRTDNDDLQQELASRPTQQEHRQLKREIDMLQRKIASLKRQAAGAVAGGAAAAGEEAVALAAAAVAAEGYADGTAWPPAEGGGGSTAWGQRGVAAAVARDRVIARLGLGVVEEYPRDVLVDLIQDVCVLLELRDATLLLPNLRKMAAVLGAIPKLEAFVAQVCESCFSQGVMFIPAAVQHSMNPGTVPQVLQHWLALLKQGEQLRQLAQQLQQLLAQRCSSTCTDEEATAGALTAVSSPIAAAGEAMQVQQLHRISQQLLAQVQHLLQVETEAIAAEDLLSAAKGLMAAQPDGLLQSLLSHVLQLFDIPDLAALPASLNKVYVHYSELMNFFRAVSSLLCLPGDAGPQAAMAAISTLLQQSAPPPSKVREAAAELQRASGISPPAADAGGGSEAEHALQALLAALGVSSAQQAAQLHQGMKQRLQRLDEVLPRYQKLASQLYERLRVVSLDDILPALDALLAAA